MGQPVAMYRIGEMAGIQHATMDDNIKSRSGNRACTETAEGGDLDPTGGRSSRRQNKMDRGWRIEDGPLASLAGWWVVSCGSCVVGRTS